MPIQIGQKPESDFNNPLGLLSDCHRRIERFLEVLTKVCERAAGGPMLPAEVTALQNALEYFRSSAPKHTADEEDSLFPRLRAAPEAQAALDCITALETDHEAAARDHHRVDAIARQWLSLGVLSEQEFSEMKQAVERLARMYARHIATEDGELFPLASRVLPVNALEEVGREMAERRGAILKI